ncbi:MAG: SBBP repeat-containing protein, partial [Ignavibacteria bacterium]
MKKFLLIFILCSIPSYSQVIEEWVQRYNAQDTSTDQARQIALDNLGNIYVTGSSDGNGTSDDIVTIKYNTFGIEQWVVRYTGMANGQDSPNALFVDKLGNVYITGFSYGINSNADYVTIKYNNNGIQQWVSKYSGQGNYWDNSNSIIVDNSGNVFITGSINFGNDSCATIKYNQLGEQQWISKFLGVGKDIVIDQFGNTFVTGYNFGNYSDYVTIKYNMFGNEQWRKTYNGPASTNNWDYASNIVIDELRNIYITGKSMGTGLNYDYATVKYDSSGSQLWVKRYNGPAISNNDDYPSCLTTDNLGNVFVTGSSKGLSSNYDFATIKYNSSGIEEWVRRYNGPINNWDAATSIATDNLGNIYVTGYSLSLNGNFDYSTIKYNLFGDEQWTLRYNGTGNSDDLSYDIALDESGNVYITGSSIGNQSNRDYSTIKYSKQQLSVNQPTPFTKWISGETSIISWDPLPWANVNIKCIINSGTSVEQPLLLAFQYPGAFNQFPWNIPDTILSYRSKIIIENAANPTQKIESDIFRIKPYLLARVDVVNNDSTYYEYRKNRDQWGFWNEDTQMWPNKWNQQFDYRGIDPFTNTQYSQWQGNSVFLNAHAEDFPDWVSWVNTFTTDLCYQNILQANYSLIALNKWNQIKGNWPGSCFGIAISNAIIFRNKTDFFARYPTFTPFTNPVEVLTSDIVKKIINEIWVHQFGEPHY